MSQYKTRTMKKFLEFLFQFSLNSMMQTKFFICETYHMPDLCLFTSSYLLKPGAGILRTQSFSNFQISIGNRLLFGRNYFIPSQRRRFPLNRTTLTKQRSINRVAYWLQSKKRAKAYQKFRVLLDASFIQFVTWKIYTGDSTKMP